MQKYFLILLISLSLPSLSQEINISEKISEIAEGLASEENDLGSVEMFSDMLFELSEDPVKINSGDEKEISRLFFLTDFQVKILIDYVKNSGMILSPFEIANIPGFDRETAEMMIPFVTFITTPSTLKDSSKLRQTVLSNFIYKNNPPDTSLLGSQWKILTKYKFRYRSFTGGFTTEKDPGEKYFSGNPPLPDFYSGYLSYNGRGIIKQIIAGDFSARFGQGTNINTRMRTGLSLTSTGFLSGRSETRPYTAADENNFFRGVAAELAYKNISLDLIISQNKTDATLNDKKDSSGTTIKSLYTTGLHTTSTYLQKKDVLKEINYIVHMSFNYRNLRTGLVISETRFSYPIMPDLSDPLNKNDFLGIRNDLYTIYYNSIIKRSVLFGELSVTGLKKYAAIQGISFKPSGRLNLNILYRSYSPGFISFHGKGPSRSSTNDNEYGVLGNLTFEAARFMFISAGTDISYYPWLRYRCSSPSMAKRYEIRIKYLPSEKLNFETLYTSKSSFTDNNEENCIPGQEETISKSIKGSVKYYPSDYLTFITQVGYKAVHPSASKGVLLLQDINLKIRKFPVSIWMRYAIFNTGGYESGLYTWENDLINSFSIPVLYGNGSRSYIMVSWKAFSRAEIRLKYGITSSYEINNRMKNNNEFRIQARISL